MGERFSVPCRFVAVLLVISGVPMLARTVRFTGEVSSGEAFSRRIAANLYFCLTPSPDSGRNAGWSIKIGPGCELKSPNYASIATPPFHGPNPLYIVAWFFDEGANAPKENRAFRFVLNLADYERMMKVVNTDLEAYSTLLERLAQGRGTLIITDRRMDSADGSIAWIRFSVRLQWPDGAAAPGGKL